MLPQSQWRKAGSSAISSGPPGGPVSFYWVPEKGLNSGLGTHCVALGQGFSPLSFCLLARLPSTPRTDLSLGETRCIQPGLSAGPEVGLLGHNSRWMREGEAPPTGVLGRCFLTHAEIMWIPSSPFS